MNLKIGDTIKCSDSNEMVSLSEELAKEDVVTDFLYEKDGEKGFWLEVVTVSLVVPTIEQIKEDICDNYCYYKMTCPSQERLDRHCEECPLKFLED